MSKKLLFLSVFIKLSGLYNNFNYLIIENFTKKPMYVSIKNPLESFGIGGFTNYTIPSNNIKKIIVQPDSLGLFFSIDESCRSIRKKIEIKSGKNCSYEKECSGKYSSCCRDYGNSSCMGSFFDQNSKFYEKFSRRSTVQENLNLVLYLSASLSKNGNPIFHLKSKSLEKINKGLISKEDIASDDSNFNTTWSFNCHFDVNNPNGNCCENYLLGNCLKNGNNQKIGYNQLSNNTQKLCGWGCP